MQCTGLKDKHGKLIFEGDIIRVDNRMLAIVRFGEYIATALPTQHLGFYLHWIGNLYEKRGYRQDILYWLYCDYHFEIIGNIHENPELLKVGVNSQSN